MLKKCTDGRQILSIVGCSHWISGTMDSAFDRSSHRRSNTEAPKQWKQPSAINKSEGTSIALKESCGLSSLCNLTYSCETMYRILPLAYCVTNLHSFTWITCIMEKSIKITARSNWSNLHKRSGDTHLNVSKGGAGVLKRLLGYGGLPIFKWLLKTWMALIKMCFFIAMATNHVCRAYISWFTGNLCWFAQLKKAYCHSPTGISCWNGSEVSLKIALLSLFQICCCDAALRTLQFV